MINNDIAVFKSIDETNKKRKIVAVSIVVLMFAATLIHYFII